MQIGKASMSFANTWHCRSRRNGWLARVLAEHGGPWRPVSLPSHVWRGGRGFCHVIPPKTRPSYRLLKSDLWWNMADHDDPYTSPRMCGGEERVHHVPPYLAQIIHCWKTSSGGTWRTMSTSVPRLVRAEKCPLRVNLSHEIYIHLVIYTGTRKLIKCRTTASNLWMRLWPGRSTWDSVYRPLRLLFSFCPISS